MAKEVVHVHALGPALLVSDLVLVLEMADDLRTAGQPPHQPPPVRRWNLHRRLYGEPAHAVPRGVATKFCCYVFKN